jgi:hypothetical protein
MFVYIHMYKYIYIWVDGFEFPHLLSPVHISKRLAGLCTLTHSIDLSVLAVCVF